MSERDPDRWLRAAGPEDGPLSALLEAGRAERPSAAQLNALAQRLEPTFDAPSPGSGGSDGGSSAVPAASAATSGPALAPLAIGTLLALAIAAAWLSTRGADPRGATLLRSARPEVAAPPQPRAAAVPPPPLPAAPAVAQPTPAPAPEPAPPTKPAAREPAEDPAAELALLEEAHRSLATAPRHTLEVAEAHRRRFPRGQYAQEREVLAIEALLALHEQARASARARHFLLRYPESSHARHVRALLAETEEAPASGAGTQLP